MASSDQLIRALKQHLKASGIHYRDVATHLELSEASVKRMFATGNISLPRLEKICAMSGWDLIDLAQAAKKNTKRLDKLSAEQEQEIAGDLVLLLVAVSVINGFTFDDIVAQYDISEHDCVRKLARLDKLKLIDLLPGNRIKLRISQDFHWDPSGPIQAFFLDKVVEQFFNSRFAKEDEKLIVLNGLLNEQENLRLQERMQRLADEFSHSMDACRALSMAQKKGNTLVVAMRRWRFSMFEELRRKDQNR